MARRKAVSSRELTEPLLARIDLADPALNAVGEPRREAAAPEAGSPTWRLPEATRSGRCTAS
jgi:Asp-tRNA(Asn)/Glu-tRNA(Gln) amidotransferase A subunit family amidase